MVEKGKSYSRVILMGDPRAFSIRRGANPHTRNWLGLKKRVRINRAIRQWHRMAETLLQYGIKIYVLPSNPERPGMVFPANAGVMLHAESPVPLSKRDYLLSDLHGARNPEGNLYEKFLVSLGVKTHRINHTFEGEADFIPWGEQFVFTYGPLEDPHWKFHWGVPPWRRVYGFRSSHLVQGELAQFFPGDKILALQLAREEFYHGDTVLCSFGPGREFLLAYGEGLQPESRRHLAGNGNVIWLNARDARAFAANSFQVLHQGKCVLFMPAEISNELKQAVWSRGVEVVPLEVGEFLRTGGGSVKCMIGDLGAWAEDPSASEEVLAFREMRDYEVLFG